MRRVSRFYQHEESLRRLVRELARDPRAFALDVGCKTGDISESLAAHVQSLVAIDPVYHDDWLGRPAVRFLAGDATALPFRSETFDVVVACECLQYIERPQAALDEFRRVLKTGGTLVASFPEGGLMATGLDPYNVTRFLKLHLQGQARAGGYARWLSAARLLEHCSTSWRCRHWERRGSIGFIYISWLIDELHGLRVRLEKGSAAARGFSRIAVRPVMELLFYWMRLDFRLRLSGLSYNNIVRLVKIAPPSDRR